MKNKTRYDRQKSAKIKRARSIILFVSVALLVLAGGALMAQKVFHYFDTAQAKQIETGNETPNDNTGNNANNDEIHGDQDPNSEKPEFVQHYLDQQMRGEMPDGADGQKVVYLTFDDGPSETVTPQILDILKAENVHATFFMVGKYINGSEVQKELVKRVVSEGNAIGIHSYSHDYNYLYPNKSVNTENFMADVEKTNTALRNILGDDFETKAIRLPGGHMTWKNTKALDDEFKKDGYSYIDWNSLSKDAEGPKKNAEQLAQEAINTAGSKEKVVLLMHDTYGKEETAKSLPAIIKYFKEQGYQFKVIK